MHANLSESLRIVQITDLHNGSLGHNNEDLINHIEELSPDLIFMTGDMLNRDDGSTETVSYLIEQLKDIAPVYYGYGNHEATWESRYHKDLHTILEQAGAVVLNNEYVDVFVNHNAIRIGGYMGYYGCPQLLTRDKNLQETERDFFEAFQNSSDYKILLNHIPTQWVDWKYLNKEEYDLDLVFSGHYHGGLWNLPIVGPVYAPYVGKFPENVRGIFVGSRSTCVLSSGLGNEYTYLPRINNPPEIVVLNLQP